MIVNATDAEAQLPSLLDRATAGEDVIIVRSGRPAIRLVRSAVHHGPRQPGLLSHLPPIPDSFFFDPLPPEELDAWE